jgi:hypothetical protein
MKSMPEISFDGSPAKTRPEIAGVMRRQRELRAVGVFPQIVRALPRPEGFLDAEVLFDHLETEPAPWLDRRDAFDQVSAFIHAANQITYQGLVPLTTHRSREQEPKDGPWSARDILEKHQSLPYCRGRPGEVHARDHALGRAILS